MNRRIPATMVSQHPDHASTPYWHDSPFIRTQEEVKECYLSFSELGASEYKWDWEGKLVDESVIERLWSDYYDYFKAHPIGKEKFLTFRLPNPKVETEFRVGRAFMNILSAAGLASYAGFDSAPLFEVILPMTETSQEIIDVQDAFVELSSLKHPLHKLDSHDLKNIMVIPLFEEVETIMNSADILAEYIAMYNERYGTNPEYIRPYVARSDPALNAGLIPTVLAIKVALSHYEEFSNHHAIETFPIIGSASLPFRGSLRPNDVGKFINEYQGVRTALIQSAFRYDFDKSATINAIAELERELPIRKTQQVSARDEQTIRSIIPHFTRIYQQSIEHLAPAINTIAEYMPKRRERVQHTGLFGYSRGVGSVKLPRAIVFTGALYTLGIPPEVISTGRGLRYAKEYGALDVIERYYINLVADLRYAGRYVNKDVIQHMAKSSPVWKDIAEDVAEIERYIGEPLDPITEEEKEHHAIVSRIHTQLINDTVSKEDIERLAVLRKSLG